MDNFQTTLWPQGAKIEVLPEARGFELSDIYKKMVDQIWFETSSEHHFNGQLLNYISFENNVLLGEFIEYKFYYAQLREPDLRPFLNIRPVAISGITTTANKVLIGKRSNTVSEFKNHYEVVPSGGVDASTLTSNRVDLFKQFEKELWEETAISSTDIREIAPFALIYDSARDSYEICAEIHVNFLTASDELRRTPEYEKLFWILKSDVGVFAKKHANECVPLTLYLLQQKNLH